MGNKMKNCSTCNVKIASNAKICPSCGAKNKKPIYKRWWFILILLIAVLSAFGSIGGEDMETPGAQSVMSEQQAEEPASTEESTEPEIAEEPEKPVNTEPTMTIGQKNALKKAGEYLNFTSFSFSGLVGQLEYEGFSNADAVWAVERCGADWNQQAALKAEEYMAFTSFSKQGLIDQLLYEGFNSEQAAYGASAVGY